MLNHNISSVLDLRYLIIDIFFLIVILVLKLYFKKIDPRDLNVENLEEAKYDEFQASGDDTISEMASHNPIVHSTATPDALTYRTPSRRLKSLVWQHFDELTKLLMKKCD